MLLSFVLSNQHFVTHFKFNFVLFGTEDDLRTVRSVQGMYSLIRNHCAVTSHDAVAAEGASLSSFSVGINAETWHPATLSLLFPIH